MRIGIFSETFLPQVNGVVTSICNTARVLSKRHEIKIFTVGKGPKKFSGCEVVRFKGATFRPYPEYKFYVPRVGDLGSLMKEDLDVVHVRSSVVFWLLARKFAKAKKIPLIGTFDTPVSDYTHYLPVLGRFGMSRKLLGGGARKYSVWYYNQCDLVTVPSEYTKRQLMSWGCKRKVYVVSNGVDIERFNPEQRCEELRKKLCPRGEALILHVGRVTKEKRVSVLINAAERLSRDLRFKLFIVGDGPAKKDLEALVKRKGLEDFVVFAGRVSERELPVYYASADLFVTASTVETQGIVLLEAMASGLPVIGAKAGAIPDLVKEGENGFLFWPGNVNILAKKIEVVLDGKGMKKSMGAKSRKMVTEHSIENVAKTMEGIYRGML